MGRSGTRSLVLDSGALIAFERADPRVRAAIRRATEASRILVPAGVVGEVWRDGSRQAQLARLLTNDAVTVPVMDEAVAKAAGALCGRSRTEDVIDASVVLAARAASAVVLTADVGDLRRIDPHILVVAI